MTSGLRTRWAAIGAAVAVTLGGGGIGLVAATSPSEATAFVPITPCRVMDTRPAPDTVGPRSTPLGEGDTHTVTVHGDNGNCTGIPSSATAVQLNVTAVGATTLTFLTLWATGETQPVASSLNPSPGEPPTPNAVTTGLDGSGQFDIFNKFGSVDVLADITGYYVDHHHDDRYYTEGEIDAVLPFAVGVDTGPSAAGVLLTTTFTSVLTLDVAAPSDGQVTVNSTANVFHDTANGDVGCAILRSTDANPSFGTNILAVQWFESEGGNSNDGNIGGTRVFDVSQGTTTFELRCREGAVDGGRFFGGAMSAIFTPAPVT